MTAEYEARTKILYGTSGSRGQAGVTRVPCVLESTAITELPLSTEHVSRATSCEYSKEM